MWSERKQAKEGKTMPLRSGTIEHASGSLDPRHTQQSKQVWSRVQRGFIHHDRPLTLAK
jgi:hypothetical protein